MSEKVIINGLWLGNPVLKPLELLTLKSFVEHGCEFHLWTYGLDIQPVPRGVVIRDGNEIMPESSIFRYPSQMLLGFGQNSYVGFSELFRYKVLYELGGWWSDLDVTCLKPLNEITDDYWFRFHGVLSIVGNIMKAPPRSELMKLCYEKAAPVVNDKQTDWHLAIRILCYYVEYLGLSNYIHNDKCNLDRLEKVNPLLWDEKSLNDIPENWYFIHWMNSVVSKSYKSSSIFGQLLEKYHCSGKPLLL